MQLLKEQLDGTQISVTDLTVMGDYVSFAVNQSAADNGYHIVIGTNLESTERGGKIINVVASSGVLIVQNLQGEVQPSEEQG